MRTAATAGKRKGGEAEGTRFRSPDRFQAASQTSSCVITFKPHNYTLFSSFWGKTN